jgi:hypothetical protein
MLFTEPIVGFISLYNAFAFGLLFAFFSSYPYVFTEVYHFSDGHVGLAFLSILIGTILAVVTFIIIDKTIYQKSKREAAAQGRMVEPEERLYTSMFGSFGIPATLFWFAWTARTDMHWIAPILAGVPFGWGMCSLFVGTPSMSSPG